MKNFFLGKHILGEVYECVMIDNEDRGVFHFLGTKAEMDHYAESNGGKVYIKTDNANVPQEDSYG